MTFRLYDDAGNLAATYPSATAAFDDAHGPRFRPTFAIRCGNRHRTFRSDVDRPQQYKRLVAWVKALRGGK